ncbi:MAG: hypothetical protein LBV58_03900 [Acholeplasmatales bacterium]|jgi:putative aldouronate transport system substrate-binding protein|nr:hypothetical protein [Acholeplasmatales bacterium]
MKKIVLLLICLIGFIAFISCDKDSNNDDSEIRFYLWSDDGGVPSGFNEVLKNFNENAGKELDLSLKFAFDTQADYKQNLNLSIASGQNNFDVVFDAQWIYLQEFAKKNYYYNLTEYFNNDSYPGLKANFTPDYLENNYFNNGVYGIPLTQTFGEISVAYIRKDFRVECANDTSYVKHPSILTSSVVASNLLDGIDNFDELEYYLYWVKDNKNGVVPSLCNNDGTWGAWDLINTSTPPTKSAQDYVNASIKQDILIKQGFVGSAYIKNDEVMAADLSEFLNPDTLKGINSYPAGFTTGDNRWQEQFQIASRWAKDEIIAKDVMSTTVSNANFLAGLGGSIVQTINNFSSYEAQLVAKNPGAELEIYVNNPVLREKRLGYQQTDFKAWNFLSIPKTVSLNKVKKIMKFFDWLFLTEENHDLFQYGIRGVNWDESKDSNNNYVPGTISNLGFSTYTFPAFELTWNPNFIRVQMASDPKVMEYSTFMYDITRYVRILYSEFTFDPNRTTLLSNAINNAELASNLTHRTAYFLGQVNNPITSWSNELSTRYSNNSLQEALRIIQEELILQLQTYIDSL